MARERISSGSTFEQEIGYSRAVVDGDWIFVSGTTGFDYAAMTIAEGIQEQRRAGRPADADRDRGYRPPSARLIRIGSLARKSLVLVLVAGLSASRAARHRT